MIAVNLSKKYGKKQALRAVNLEIGQECVGLLGPNGAGKTTLIKCLAGFVNPSGGEVLSGTDDTKLNIGYLPQQFSFLPNLTVWESLTFLGLLEKIDRSTMDAEIASVIDLTNLSDYRNVRVKALSGGTLRRLGIAQALLGNPDTVFLDEPTAGLDIEERGKLKSVLSRSKEKCGLLIATHMIEDIAGLCDRVLVLKDGQLIFSGKIEEMNMFATSRICISADESPLGLGGIASGSSFADGKSTYRFVMPHASNEYVTEPTIEEGYLALLHGFRD